MFIKIYNYYLIINFVKYSCILLNYNLVNYNVVYLIIIWIGMDEYLLLDILILNVLL